MLVWCSRAAALASRWKRTSSLGSSSRWLAQDLQRHAAAQRFLLGLVDNAHAAAADFTQQAEVAQPLAGGAPAGTSPDRRCSRSTSPVPGLKSSTNPEDREELADLAGQVGMTRGIFVDRRTFASPAAIEEFLGEVLDRGLVSGRAGTWSDSRSRATRDGEIRGRGQSGPEPAPGSPEDA